MPICDKCAARVSEGSSFCPRCGDPITETDYGEQVIRGQAEAIEIRFGYSSSPNYRVATELVSAIPSHVVDEEERAATHSVVLDPRDVELAINLWDLVGGWKSAEMLIAGRRATKKDLTYGALGCYQRRQGAYNPKQYCYGEHFSDLNIWGCKRIGLPFLPWAEWFRWGEFDASGRWIFDKNRIRHEIEKGIYENGICPAFDRERVEQTFALLPDVVDPRHDPNWEYLKEWKEGKGEVAVGVHPVIERANEYVLQDDFTPDWTEAQRQYESQQRNVNVEIGAGGTQRKQAKAGCVGGAALILLVILSVLL